MNFRGSRKPDTLSGGNAADSLDGANGNDLLIGLGGNDTLNGGIGADLMIGGLGDDTYLVDNIGDIVQELAGQGTDTVIASISYILPANTEILVLTGNAILAGTGNALNNRILGNATANLLRGLDGNDWLDGGAGNDTLDGGTGTDTLVGGTGDDLYIIDQTTDVVQEAANAGNDAVTASASFTLPGNVEQLTLTGTANLSGFGNDLANRITGNDGNNRLTGGSGADTLIGGLGADTLIGGAGSDLLTGGAGPDVFTILTALESAPGTGHDVITDFAAAEDRIDATALSTASPFIFIGNSPFSVGGGPQIRASVQGSSTLVQFDLAQGDGVADAEIALTGTPGLGITNFIGAIAPPTKPPGPVDPLPGIHVGVNDNLQAMVNAAGAGATFILDAGIHRLQSVTPLDGQTFLGESGAVLDGARLLSGFAKVGQTWVIGGQTQAGEVRAAAESADGFAMPGNPDQVFLDNHPLLQVASLGAVKAGSYFFDHTSAKIYLGSDPTGHTVEASVSPFAFAGSATGVTIKGLIIEKYATPVQYGAIGNNAPPTGWTIENNEVRLNFGVGIIAGTGSRIINNSVHDNGEMGLGGNGNNILVQGNNIAHNGYFSGIDPGWEGGGTKFALTDGLVVRNNNSHDNNGYGLWTDIDNINTLYEGNIVTNNLSGGISHEISYAAVIRNNTLIGNGTTQQTWLWGAGIQIQNSKNVEVYGNTVDTTGGGNGIALIQQDRGTGQFGLHLTTGNSVHDNTIISRDIDLGVSGAIADYDPAAMLGGGNSFDRNQYQVSDPQNEHWAWGSFYDWATYRAVTGQDAHSTLALL